MATANFFAPGFDDQVEQQNIERQRKMADLLRQQSAEPMQNGSMVSGHYVAPSFTQGLAKLLQGYNAGKMGEDADAKQKALAEAVKGRRTEEWGKVAPLLAGTPAREVQPLTPNDDDGNVNPTIKMDAKGPDLRAAYAQAMQSQDPSLQQFGMSGMTKLPEIEAAQQEREAARAFRTQEAEAARAARVQQLEMAHQQRMDQLAATNASRADMMKAQQDFQREMKKMSSGQGAQPYFQPVQTAQGVFAFNARTGQVEPVKVNGAPIIGAQADPTLQGNIAGAKESAKAGVEKQVETGKANKRSDQLLSAATEAERLLKMGPTNSGVGAAVDWLGNKVGVSSGSADVASKLETLSGWMTANVPRMEGPQSNIDVQNYQVMAAKVGDKTIPVEQRMSALTTLRGLQEKYKHLNGAATPAPTADQTAAGAPKRVRYDAQGNQIK